MLNACFPELLFFERASVVLYPRTNYEGEVYVRVAVKVSQPGSEG